MAGQISLYVFCISLGILLYAYLGYGILAAFLGLFRKKRPLHPFANIPVTVIVPAYNEAGILLQKIQNTLTGLQNFEKAQVILITDGSEDGSADLKFNDDRVLHLHEPARLGKSAAINKAMERATGDIVIITDANAMVNESGFQQLVSAFSHEKIGAVSGEKKVLSADGSTGGEGLYWKYESFIKKQSAHMYSLTGAAGELIAIRRSVFTPIPIDAILDDMELSLSIIRQHKIIGYEPGAYATEPPSNTLADEFSRKVRISAGVFQTLQRNGFVFNPFKHTLFVFQFFSHRILRWLASIPCLLSILVTNVLLVFSYNTYTPLLPVLTVLLYAQAIFYLWALVGMMLRNGKLPGFFFLPFYFLMMNVAVVAGWFRFIRKKESVMWKKVKR